MARCIGLICPDGVCTTVPWSCWVSPLGVFSSFRGSRGGVSLSFRIIYSIHMYQQWASFKWVRVFLCFGTIKVSAWPSDRWSHCNKNPIYVFLEMNLRGLVPNFYLYIDVRDLFIPNSYIHESVSNLYIPRNGLPSWLQQNRQTNPGNI